MTAAPRIEKLRRDRPLESFDCGKEALNRHLVHHALQNQKAGAAQTYLALQGAAAIGYYTLVVGRVDHDGALKRLIKGLARHPVPIMLLARLAVSVSHQGQRIGQGLLKDAVLRTLQAADIAGIRVFAVHAKDEDTRAFYERFDFAPSPTDPFHLLLLLKDVKALLDEGGRQG